MRKYLNQALSLAYLFFFRLPWRKIFRHYDRKSNNVVWIYPSAPFQFFEYLGRSIIFFELSYIDGFARLGIPFRVVIGRKIGRVHDSRIFYHVSHEFMNIFRFKEYPTFLVGTIKALEAQRNEMYLSSAEVEYWENKAFMHRQFDRLDISQPKTYILRAEELADFRELSYPFIVKEVHSQGSKGLHKIDSAERQSAVATMLAGKGEILAQRIVNMTRDLRVTIVGDEIVLAYWRINPEKEWRPTSTTHGSSVDFGNFPEQWRSYFLEITRRMGLRTAAYDVCWEGDDVTTMPIILEVSPYFQPNAVLPAHLSHVPYRTYKKMIFTKEPYFKTKVDAYCEVGVAKVRSAFADARREEMRPRDHAMQPM